VIQVFARTASIQSSPFGFISDLSRETRADVGKHPGHVPHELEQGIKLKGYYPYFGVQPFTFPSKYFATLQKGRGNFL
jgi:hypothetical protein